MDPRVVPNGDRSGARPSRLFWGGVHLGATGRRRLEWTGFVRRCVGQPEHRRRESGPFELRRCAGDDELERRHAGDGRHELERRHAGDGWHELERRHAGDGWRELERRHAGDGWRELDVFKLPRVVHVHAQRLSLPGKRDLLPGSGRLWVYNGASALSRKLSLFADRHVRRKMLDVQTSPGSPVRVRKILPADEEHDEREAWEDTYTICRPFKLAQDAEGLEGIPAGCPVVYVAGVRLVRCENVERREGLTYLPNPNTWGPFYPRGPKWRRMIEAARQEATELLRKLRGNGSA